MQVRLSRQHWFSLFVLLVFASHWLVNRLPLIPPQHAAFGEWALLIDLGISLPIAYVLLCRPGSVKQFLEKWAGLAMAGLLFGSFAIPDANKHLWKDIEHYRAFGTMLAVAVEAGLLLYVAALLYRMLKGAAQADGALESAVQRVFGAGAAGKLMLFEVRIWYYALFMRRAPQFAGERHFYSARNGGNASNQVGFIIVMLFEWPLQHMLLHYMWSPTAAWVTTALTAWGMVYMFAEYRATLVRPVSLGRDGVLLRVGVLNADASIPYAMIESVERVPQPGKREQGKRYYRNLGGMNVEIRLRDGASLPTLLGDKAATHAVLGLDEPDAFVAALRAKMAG